MNLETLIVAVFRLVEDSVRDLCRSRKLRQRGPAPVLADSEVLTVETVVPRPRHGPGPARPLPAPLRPPVPAPAGGPPHHLRAPGGQPLGRRARALAAPRRRDPALALADSLPVPACRFARAHRCRGLRGFAAFGYDALAHRTFYGLRLHLRVSRPGVITAAALAPANEADRAVAPRLLAGLTGWALGDKGCWSPSLRAELAPGGLDLIAPRRGTGSGTSRWPAWLVRTRRRVETVLSQLTERFHAKRTRARDEWHPMARWLRKLASHTVAVPLCQRAGLDPLAFAQLLTG